MDVYLDIFVHIIVSLLIGFGLWKMYGKKKKNNLWVCFIFSLIAGLLIDVDHFIDYFFYFGISFDYNLFMSGQSFLRSGKNYVFFHGWEYVFFFSVWAFYANTKKTKMIVTVVAVSMLFHLLIDSVIFGVPFMNYFIIYRILNNFTSLQ